MYKPDFEIETLNKGFALNDRGRTVALVSQVGYIDWILKSPMQDGPLIDTILKETHLGHTYGLIIRLITPVPATDLDEYAIEDSDDAILLTANCVSNDGSFTSQTTARLQLNDDGSRYEWAVHTDITNQADEPIEVPNLEYNNVYPAYCGRCFLYAPMKKFNSTIITDRNGTIWNFPHQHQLHYGRKMQALEFAEGSMAGFFGEETGSPVVIVNKSSIEPYWGICDMYYDLHCCGRPTRAMNPGETWSFDYDVKFLGRQESNEIIAASKQIPINDEDRAQHNYPRFDLGLNTFTKVVNIDKMDDASAWRTNPPVKVWDKEEGHSAKGSLRITNDVAQETIWTSVPPTEIPENANLNITGMFKTEGVEGKGAFIRVRYHTFEWHPEPHVEWVKDLESPPVTGTTPGWVKVSVPELHVPKEDFDYLVIIEFVLDGKGKAWLTDVDVDLQPAEVETPALQRGSSQFKKVGAGSGGSASGSAM